MCVGVCEKANTRSGKASVNEGEGGGGGGCVCEKASMSEGKTTRELTICCMPLLVTKMASPTPYTMLFAQGPPHICGRLHSKDII